MSDPKKQVLETKIKERILDANRHLNALQDAAASFGGDFDADEFEAAWLASDSEQLRRAYAVQAGFENVINTCIAIAVDLCELEGWSAGPASPSSIEALKLLHTNGVIEGKARAALKDAQEERSDVQHDYVVVAALAVHEHVVAVLEYAPLLLQGAADQLRDR
ncbi:MAG: hypothetical protein ACYDA3_07255 [Gaiellaceae bacterium]